MKDEETGEPIPKLKEDLEALGVQVVDSAGQIRSTFDIYKDLGRVWNDLSKNKQIELAEKLGGKMQANLTSTLLENSKMMEDAFDKAQQSAGSATKEFETYEESVSYKLGQLEESIKQFYTTLVSSDAIKAFADMGISLMETLTWLTDKFGLMPVAITGTVTALLLLNKHFRTTMTNFTSMFTPIGKFNGLMDTLKVKLETSALATEKQIKETKLASAMFSSLGQSTSMLGVKLAGLEAKLMATKAGIIATKVAVIALQAAMSFGLSLAISAGIELLDNFINRSEKLKESNDNLRDSYNNLGTDITNLQDYKKQYEDLSSAMQDESLSTDELNSKKSELSNLINSLTQQYPELIGVLGNANISYDEQVKAIQRVIDAKKDEQALKATQYFNDNDISGYNDIEEQVKNMSKWQDKLTENQKKLAELKAEAQKGDNGWFKQNDIEAQIKATESYISAYQKDLQETKSQLQDILLYESQLENYNGEGKFSGSEVTKIQEAINAMDLFTQSNKLAKDEIEKATNATQNQVNVQEQLAGVLANSTTALQQYADSVNGAEWSKDKTPAEIYGSAIDEVEKLQGYINEMNSEAGYTPQLVSELIQQYPELGSRINDASAVQDFLNQKIADQVSIQEQAYEIMVGNDTEFYNSKIAKNEEFKQSVDNMLKAFVDESGRAYEADWGAYTTLNEMKQDVLGKFAQGINNFLKQFVDGNGQAYQVDLQNFNNLTQAKAEALNKLNSLLKRLQQNTITSLGAQQQAYSEMSAMATGGVLGLEKAKSKAERFDQMGQDPKILKAYAENAKKIAEVKGKIQEIEDLGGLDLKGYSAQTYNGSAFSPSSGGLGGKSGKGGSGSSSAEKVQEDMEKLSDRYWDYNNAVTEAEKALQSFETAMKKADDDKKISNLNKEIELLDRKREAYKRLAEEQKRDLADKKRELSQYGFTFYDSTGAIGNYNYQIDKLVNEANAISDADAKKARQEVVKNIQKTAEEYNKLLEESIPDTQNTIDDILNDIIDAQEEVADILEKQRDKYIDNLKEQYDKRKEYLQKEKDLMNKTYEEQDRQDELKEKEETIIKLKEQLQDAIREGNTEIQKNLWEQIQEAQNEINKFIRDAELEDANDMFDNSMDNLDDELDNTINKIEEQLSDEQILALVQSGVRDLNSVLEEIGNSSQNVDTLFQNLTSYTDDWVTNITSFKDILESIKATNLGLLTTGVDYSNLNSKASMTSVGNISVAVNVNGSLTDDNYARFADMISDMAVEKVNNELKNY